MIGFHILDAKNLRFPRHFSPAQISQLAEFGQRSRMTQEENRIGSSPENGDPLMTGRSGNGSC
jgi:hypothetical protein